MITDTFLTEISKALDLAGNQASTLASRSGSDHKESRRYRQDEQYFRSLSNKITALLVEG